jgi:hypothetical protein
MGKRMSRQEAAFASIGAAFVKLLRDDGAPKRKRDVAWRLADWLHLHKLTDDEAHFFMVNTGIVFDSDLLLRDQNYQPPHDYPRPELDDDIPF